MHGFTPSSLLLLLVAGAGISSAAPIGVVLPAAAAISALPSGGIDKIAAAPSSSVSASSQVLPSSSAVAVPTTTATATATASAASASSAAPTSSAPASSSKPTASASASSTTAPLPAPSLCPGVVEWTGAVFLDNDDGTIDTRMTMKTACPPGAKGIKLTIVDTSTCSPVISTTRNLGFTTLEANVYDSNLKTISEGQSNDGKSVTLSCTNTDSISLMGIFHGPKRVMSDALSFTAPKVEVV